MSVLDRAEAPDNRAGAAFLAADEWAEARLPLAQACAKEADLRGAVRDYLLVAWTTYRRWQAQPHGWTYAETVRRQAQLWARTERAAWARGLPWGPLPAELARAPHDAEGWAVLRETLERFAAGRTADPCPGAVTWSGRRPNARERANVERVGLRRLDCGTSNIAWGRM